MENIFTNISATDMIDNRGAEMTKETIGTEAKTEGDCPDGIGDDWRPGGDPRSRLRRLPVQTG